MPWVRAKLRDQLIYARATAQGALDDQGGFVEVRYKPNDGRRYRARAQNLSVVDATPLPDETCGPAEDVASSKGAAPASSQGSSPTSSVARASSGKPSSSAKTSGTAPAPAPEGAIVAYTDGACSGNPGPAGLGVIIDDAGKRTELSEYLGTATNNIAELTAVLRALERTPDPARPLVLHTDSQYAIGVLSKGWKAKANTELVAKIKEALRRVPHVTFVYVRGHAGVPLNERADELARTAVESRKTRG